MPKKFFDFTTCDMVTISKITRMISLIKASGLEMSSNKLTQKYYFNAVDTQPRVNTVFEPGEAYVYPKT